MTPRRARVLRAGALLAILAATVGVYAPSLHGVFQFDDYSAIQVNWALRDLGRLMASFGPADLLGPGRPVTDLTFALDFAIGGLDPFPYRVGSLLVHLAAVLLCWALARQILRRAGHARADLLALAAAAVFALHPIQSESVCYVCQRSEALSSALYMAALLLYARGLEAWPGRRAAAWAAAGTGVAILAIGAKTIAVTLPAAFLLYAVALGPGAEGAAPTGRRALRALALGAGAWALTLASVARNLALLGPGETAGLHAGELGPWRYLLTQLRAHWWYARLLAWPADQTVGAAIDPSPVVPDLATVAAGAATVALLAAVAIPWWRGEREGEPAPALRVAAFGVAWWYLLLAPTSSVIPVADITFEHRAYLAALGAILAMVVALDRLVERLEGAVGGRARVIAVGVAVAACAALGVTTALRARVWTTELALWEDEAAKHPSVHRIVDNYAYALTNERRYPEAIRVFRRAQALAQSPREIAATARNMGAAWLEMGNADAALAVTEWGLSAAPLDWEVHVVRAQAFVQAGRFEEARAAAARATELGPDAPSTHDILGVALSGLRRSEEALAAFRTARAIDPGAPVYADHVFHALAQLGRNAEACAAWAERRALAGTLDGGMARIAARLGCGR